MPAWKHGLRRLRNGLGSFAAHFFKKYSLVVVKPLATFWNGENFGLDTFRNPQTRKSGNFCSDIYVKHSPHKLTSRITELKLSLLGKTDMQSGLRGKRSIAHTIYEVVSIASAEYCLQQ